MTSMPAIDISLSSLPPYECGAVLFTYLAFPGPGDTNEQLRAKAHAALCHLALRAIAKEDDSTCWMPQTIKPAYALLTDSECRVALRTYERCYLNRLQAATMAKPFIQETANGAPPKLPPGVKSLTLASMAEWRERLDKPELDAPDPKNFLTRVWRPSLPVLPAALGLSFLYKTIRCAGLTPPPVYDLIRSVEAIRCVVETAQALEEKILGVPQFLVHPKQLLRFRFT